MEIDEYQMKIKATNNEFILFYLLIQNLIKMRKTFIFMIATLFAMQGWAQCPVPTGLEVVDSTHSSITISWVEENGVDEWLVEYGIGGSYTDTISAGRTLEFDISDLLPETTYNVRIRAICGTDTTAYSLVLFGTTERTPCSPPSQVVEGDYIDYYSAEVVWTPGDNTHMDGSGGIMGWIIEYGEENGNYTDNVFVNVLSYPDTLLGLNPLTTYFLCVKTICAAGDTSVCSTGTVTTIGCYPPTAAAAGGITASSATITWTPGGTESEWSLICTPTGGTPSAPISATSPFQLTGLQAETGYTVCVRAVCGPGDTSACSECTFTTLAGTPPCVTPTNLTVTDSTESTITVKWTRGNAETQWKVTYYVGAASTMDVADDTTYTITGLSRNTTVRVCVKAYCPPNESGQICIETATAYLEGIQDITLSDGVKLYPNPAIDNLTIEMESKFNTIEITNVLGQSIYRANVTDNQTSIDIVGYSTGMYYVKLQGDNGMVTKKFVKR